MGLHQIAHYHIRGNETGAAVPKVVEDAAKW